MVVTFKEENLLTFKHLFLKDYVDGSMDTYAVYRQADAYDHIDHIIRQVGFSVVAKKPKKGWMSVYFDHRRFFLLLHDADHCWNFITLHAYTARKVNRLP